MARRTIGIGRPTGEGITDGNVGLGIWDADSPEALANARLIAAAPVLLAALKTIRDCNRKSVTGRESAAAWRAVNAAIAAAEGHP